jgi:hypothetical protein
LPLATSFYGIYAMLPVQNGLALFYACHRVSPDFMTLLPLRGLPRIFLSHGAADSVLLLELCSSRTVYRPYIRLAIGAVPGALGSI